MYLCQLTTTLQEFSEPLQAWHIDTSHCCSLPAVLLVSIALLQNNQVARGSTVPLPHLSLLEVAGLPLLFMVNSMAVQRAVARSAHLAM